MCVPLVSPKTPAMPTPVIPESPKPLDPELRKAREDERRRARAAFGRERTILTGGLGLEQGAPVAKKTLLGE